MKPKEAVALYNAIAKTIADKGIGEFAQVAWDVPCKTYYCENPVSWHTFGYFMPLPFEDKVQEANQHNARAAAFLREWADAMAQVPEVVAAEDD